MTVVLIINVDIFLLAGTAKDIVVKFFSGLEQIIELQIEPEDRIFLGLVME